LVVDTSALLAYVLSEPLEDWIYHQLSANLAHLHMSTVNYTEALICISDRYPAAKNVVADLVERSVVQLVPPTAYQAEIAARARFLYPLNLGDCFAYALAKDHDLPLLTLDHDFRNCDVKVILPPIKM
jgi:ribonuclease VapC